MDSLDVATLLLHYECALSGVLIRICSHTFLLLVEYLETVPSRSIEFTIR